MYRYKILHKSNKSKARVGELYLPHGMVRTPVFMPVGTVGAVKTMTSEDLKQAGSEIILANTYHLYLRPGDALIKRLGGLNNYMKWDKPILTDSGGYQVFSLGEGIRNFSKSKLKQAKISGNKVTFYSHINGSKHVMTPEKSIRIQNNLGSDLVMAFDDCPADTDDRERVGKAVERTMLWYEKCEKESKKVGGGKLVPICQGGRFEDLRKESCLFLNNTKAPVLAIGGVSVGEDKKEIYKVVDWCTEYLDEKRPRYLMGVGYPEDIVQVVKRGVDMFDCVLPTRLARHGTAWIKSKNRSAIKLDSIAYGYEQINLLKNKFTSDGRTLDERCRCELCKNNFSRSYIRHLIKEKEPLGIHLLTVHNLTFVFNLINDIRRSIKNNNF